MPGRGNRKFFEWGTGFQQQLLLFQVSKRCLLDVCKDNPVIRKVKNKYELNGQQDSLKLNVCKSSERIGKWGRKKDKFAKFSYSNSERKQPRRGKGIVWDNCMSNSSPSPCDITTSFLGFPLACSLALDQRAVNGYPGRSWWNEQSCNGFNDQPVCVM